MHLLVQRGDLVEVDVLVQRELHGGGDVVRVVVLCPALMMVVVVVVLVVAVVRHCPELVLLEYKISVPRVVKVLMIDFDDGVVVEVW